MSVLQRIVARLFAKGSSFSMGLEWVSALYRGRPSDA